MALYRGEFMVLDVRKNATERPGRPDSGGAPADLSGYATLEQLARAGPADGNGHSSYPPGAAPEACPSVAGCTPRRSSLDVTRTDSGLAGAGADQPGQPGTRHSGPPEAFAGLAQPATHTVQRFLSDYLRGERLGQGTTGSVFRVTSKETGAQYACKIMALETEGRPGEPEPQVQKELRMLATISGHPSFASLHDYFMNGTHCMIVTELLGGGNLQSFLEQRRERLTENECRTIVLQIIQGLAFLHARGAAHRDLKPENVMLSRKGDISSIKLVDMGLSKFMHSSKHTVCGSPLYLSPEALLQTVTAADGKMKARYDEGVDMWSCGIMLYILLSGEMPYSSTQQQGVRQLFREIASCSIHFKSPVWKSVSPEPLHLLKQMLNWDPHQRITAEEALVHPWLR